MALSCWGDSALSQLRIFWIDDASSGLAFHTFSGVTKQSAASHKRKRSRKGKEKVPDTDDDEDDDNGDEGGIGFTDYDDGGDDDYGFAGSGESTVPRYQIAVLRPASSTAAGKNRYFSVVSATLAEAETFLLQYGSSGTQ